MSDQSHNSQVSIHQVTSSVSPIRRAPLFDGPQETQMLFGELFEVLSEEGDWAFGHALFDGYEGYVLHESLTAEVAEVTHRVRAQRTYRFSKPDLKSLPLGLISMNAKLHVEAAPSDKFVQDQAGGWVFADHLAPLAEQVSDHASVAEQFLGAPYFWGGRESLGLDCSALVQNAFEQKGQQVPRDSGPQETWFAKHGDVIAQDVSDTGSFQAQRGDLVFWPGHVGIMVDGQNMIHANATYMAVTINPLAEFAARILDRDGPIRQIIRPGN